MAVLMWLLSSWNDLAKPKSAILARSFVSNKMLLALMSLWIILIFEFSCRYTNASAVPMIISYLFSQFSSLPLFLSVMCWNSLETLRFHKKQLRTINHKHFILKECRSVWHKHMTRCDTCSSLVYECQNLKLFFRSFNTIKMKTKIDTWHFMNIYFVVSYNFKNLACMCLCSIGVRAIKWSYFEGSVITENEAIETLVGQKFIHKKAFRSWTTAS